MPAKQREGLSLAELVKSLRNEIRSLREDPEIVSDPIFNVKDITLDLKVVVRKSDEMGIRFLLVSMGDRYTSEKVGSIRLRLEPLVAAKPRVAAASLTKKEPLLLSPKSVKELREVMEKVAREESHERVQDS
jgi:hypothetical protein